MPEMIVVRSTGRSTGFSLVELLVVLVLMGLVASLAYPRIQTALLAYERQTMEDKLAIFLRQQIAESNLTGVSFSIPKGRQFSLESNDSEDRIDIIYINDAQISESTLRYSADEKLLINSNGFCARTRVSFVFYDARSERLLSPPFCEIDKINNG